MFMERENLPVPQTSLRSDVISTGIHRHHNAPGGILQNQGSRSDFLPRRYTDPGELTYVALPAQRLCVETAPGCGFQMQYKEVSSDAITSFPIPRSELEYDRDASFTSTFKTGSNSQYDLSYGTNTYDQDERLYGVTGQNEFCSYGDNISMTALSPTSILSTTSHLRSELVGFTHDLNTRSSRLTALVELATVERAKFENESSHASDLNRCIPDRVGCSNGPVVHPRPMDGHRKTKSYQPSGTEDCFVYSLALVTSTETSDCGTSVGQYDGCGLPTEVGGHTIQIPALPGSGDSDLGQPKQDSAATKLSTRSDKYASRRSVTFKGARRMDVGSYSSREDFSTYGMPTVDLFASERSKQVPHYFTTDRHDPHGRASPELIIYKLLTNQIPADGLPTKEHYFF